jgi:hypothetical protein
MYITWYWYHAAEFLEARLLNQNQDNQYCVHEHDGIHSTDALYISQNILPEDKLCLPSSLIRPECFQTKFCQQADLLKVSIRPRIISEIVFTPESLSMSPLASDPWALDNSKRN